MDVLPGKEQSGSALLADGASVACGLMQLLDELAHGVLVTSAQGRLLHANQAAHRELGCKRVMEMRRGMVHACTPEGGRALKEALARAAEGKRGLIELSAAGAAALTVAVVPLRPERPGALPNVALLFARESVCDALMLAFFARSHALTATEEHVLGILCQGLSAPQAAAQMEVAVSTVRSHVRSLCAKTRSSGVRQLVIRVAVLPPMAPSSWSQPMH